MEGRWHRKYTLPCSAKVEAGKKRLVQKGKNGQYKANTGGKGMGHSVGSAQRCDTWDITKTSLDAGGNENWLVIRGEKRGKGVNHIVCYVKNKIT